MALTLAATLAILVATLRPAAPPTFALAGPWCVVCGAHGGADLARNVVLFLPLGAGLALLRAGVWHALLIGLALTSFVEGVQLLVLVGRDASAGDLLANTTGAMLGFGLTRSRRAWLHPPAPAARRLAIAGGSAWLALTVAAAWAIAPAPAPPGSSIMRFPPRADRVRAYEGAILEASLAGRPVHHLLGTPHGAPADDYLPAAPPITVAARVHAMPPPGTLRPVVLSFGPTWEEVLTFGQRRTGLVLRYRMRASTLRLPNLSHVLRDAFPREEEIPPGTDPRRGPEVRVAGTLAGGQVSLSAEWDGRTRATTLALSPHHAWLFFASPLALDDGTRRLSALWVAAFLVPVAFWARRGSAPGRDAITAATTGVGVAAVMIGVPAAAGLAPPDVWQWLGAVVGPVVGWRLGAGLTRCRDRPSGSGEAR